MPRVTVIRGKQNGASILPEKALSLKVAFWFLGPSWRTLRGFTLVIFCPYEPTAGLRTMVSANIMGPGRLGPGLSL